MLDFDRDAIAVDHHHAAGNRHIVGEDFHLVLFGRVELDDRATAEPHDLMDGHCGRPEDDGEIDRDFIQSWH